jgi:ABC-2 type transport system ATP-binding protein
MVDKDTGRVQVRAGGLGSQVLVEAVRSLDAAGVPANGFALRRPSLDDVFLALTGHAAEQPGDAEAGGPARAGRGRGRAGAGPGGAR